MASATERLAQIQARIEGLEEYLKTEKARRLVPIIKRSGWHKGEVKDLTPVQFRRLIGYPPKKASIKHGKVPWEYCLDQLATELGYSSDWQLKKAIEDAGRKLHELEELRKEVRRLKSEVKKERKKVKPRVKFLRAPIQFDGHVDAKDLMVGSQRVGVLVRHPSRWTIHITDNHRVTRRVLEAPVEEARYAGDAEKVAKKVFGLNPIGKKSRRKRRR